MPHDDRTAQGVLELNPKGFGFLRNPARHYAAQPADPYVPSPLIQRHGLREGLLLAGHTWGESHIVLNAGGLVDPGAQVSSGRPVAIEGGLDLDLHFGKSPLSITGEFASVHFFSADADQLNATGGVTYGVTDDLDLSIVGLVGFLGGDRAGVLFGVSPKFALWK